MYLERNSTASFQQSIENFPVTALIGPRQCGKSTLVKHVLQHLSLPSIFLDLERPSDLQKLDNAEWFFSSQKDKIICLDEVQRKPELFPLIRSLTDEWNRPACFVLLGSASRDLLKQSSESLAGRIVYKNLSPFLWTEVSALFSMEDFMLRGGFPRSLLARNDALSFEWRLSFISTFLERDLLQWLNFTPVTMQRLWRMLAHLNGQTVNYSRLGKALGVSNQTIRNYIDLLKGTFMLDVLEPYSANAGKRLVKAPKVYISDSGIAAALLNLSTFEELSGSPAIGAIWEQVVMQEIKGKFPEAECYFYRTAGGAEIDFLIRLKSKLFAVECKAGYSPTLSKGNHQSISDTKPDHCYVVFPGASGWSMKKGIDVVSLSELCSEMQKHL
jgi:predicted AAA+ superfamily ATPase